MNKLYDDNPYNGSGDFKWPFLAVLAVGGLIGSVVLLIVMLL